jgi:phosphatidylserine/phosphatidylglycerophosphate/cardiolipin synthase-like enzyme
MRSIAGLWVLTLALAACGGSETTDTGDEDLSAAERTIITLSNQSTQRLYVSFPPKASPDLAKAVVAAAQRGVDTRAVLKSTGDFDSTWTLQQQLESSGVDTDVRPDDVADDALAVADSTALLAQGSKTRREKRPEVVDALARKYQAALDAHAPQAGGKLLGAGQVRLLPMPDSSRDRIVELIRAAKSSIDLEIYQLQDRAVVAALEDAARRGVRVRVMLEPKTVGFQNFVPVSNELKSAHVEVTTTPPDFDAHHNVDHAKFAILDGKELVFSSGNLVRSGLGGVTDRRFDNRDFWIEDTREASVRDAQRVFDADLARRSTKGDEFPSLVLTPDNAKDRILSLIRSAKTSLRVYNQSLSDADVIQAILDAKKRGVDVRVLLGFQPDSPKNPQTIEQLRKGGVDAKLLRRHYLHAKAIIADDRGYVGSQNFTGGGLGNNRELGEIIDDASFARQLGDVFDGDFADSDV